jgi:hypothetical protein
LNQKIATSEGDLAAVKGALGGTVELHSNEVDEVNG